jgi:hypothetical protein
MQPAVEGAWGNAALVISFGRRQVTNGPSHVLSLFRTGLDKMIANKCAVSKIPPVLSAGGFYFVGREAKDRGRRSAPQDWDAYGPRSRSFDFGRRLRQDDLGPDDKLEDCVNCT